MFSTSAKEKWKQWSCFLELNVWTRKALQFWRGKKSYRTRKPVPTTWINFHKYQRIQRRQYKRGVCIFWNLNSFFLSVSENTINPCEHVLGRRALQILKEIIVQRLRNLFNRKKNILICFTKKHYIRVSTRPLPLRSGNRNTTWWDWKNVQTRVFCELHPDIKIEQ